jgi:hypothetical protein
LGDGHHHFVFTEKHIGNQIRRLDQNCSKAMTIALN